MTLSSLLRLLEAGGPGSGRHSEGGLSRSELAKLSYKPSTQAKQQIADQSEHELSKALGLPRTPDNHPFDLMGKGVGVEIKTVIDNKNDKITMHPPSRRRKEEFAAANGIRMHTVVVDKRGPNPKFYHSPGVGAFRIGSMRPVGSMKELGGLLK